MAVIPRFSVLPSNQTAVKFVRGRPRPVPVGIYWWWPLFDEIVQIASAEQAIRPDGQLLTTADGTSVFVKATAVVEIVDPIKAIATNWDVADTIVEYVQAATARAIAASNWDDLSASSLILSIESACGQLLPEAGARLVAVNLTDLVETFVLNGSGIHLQ